MMKKSKRGGSGGFRRSLNLNHHHSSVHPDNRSTSTATASDSFFRASSEDLFFEELLAIDREMTRSCDDGRSQSNFLDYYSSNAVLDLREKEKGNTTASSSSMSASSHSRGRPRFGNRTTMTTTTTTTRMRRRVSLNDVDFTGGSRRESLASTCSGGESVGGCSSNSGSGSGSGGGKKSRGGGKDRERNGKIGIGGGGRNAAAKMFHYAALKSLFGAAAAAGGGSPGSAGNAGSAADSRENPVPLPTSSGSPSSSNSKTNNDGKIKKKTKTIPRRHSISEIIPGGLHFHFHSKKPSSMTMFDASSFGAVGADSAEIDRASEDAASSVAGPRPKFRPPVVECEISSASNPTAFDSNAAAAVYHLVVPLKSQPRKTTRRSSLTGVYADDRGDVRKNSGGDDDNSGKDCDDDDNLEDATNGKPSTRRKWKRMTKLARRMAAGEREALLELELDLDLDLDLEQDLDYDRDEEVLDRLDFQSRLEEANSDTIRPEGGTGRDDEGVRGAIAGARREERGAASSSRSASGAALLPSASTAERNVDAVSSSSSSSWSHFPSVTTATAAAAAVSSTAASASSASAPTSSMPTATAQSVVVNLITRLKSEPARPTRRSSSTNYQRLSLTTLEEADADGGIYLNGDFKDEEPEKTFVDEYDDPHPYPHPYRHPHHGDDHDDDDDDDDDES
ncbi:hypothetical protein ACHAXS_001205, partial [Conticribra weissflogii]